MKTLLEHEVKALFRDKGFLVPQGVFIGKGDDIPHALNLSYPLVAKVSSKKIRSKSDLGGVRINIQDEKSLRSHMAELMAIDDAEGVLVEEMLPSGLEVIIGGVIDRQFGPVVMFGLGGILVEVYRDTAFGLAPLSEKDAGWLIQQVKGYVLLEGYRGKPAVDRDSLIRLLLSVSEIIATGEVDEIDLNPVSLYPDRAVILDAKMTVNAP